MKKIFCSIILFAFSFVIGGYSYLYLSGRFATFGIFISGTIFGIFLMFLKLNVKNNKINSYKRELEKESIISDENSAKVKVLEQKIQVLEKALENSINKNK